MTQPARPPQVAPGPLPGRPSRRLLLGGALGAAGVAVTGAGFAAGRSAEGRDRGAPGAAGPGVVSCYGAHQAGITTPTQERLAFAAFDVTTSDRTELMHLLGTWAAATAQLTRGLSVGEVEGVPLAAPIDTGEAMDLSASNLTITVGLGPGLFDHRFGLAQWRPAALEPIPPLPGDNLDPRRSGGDLGVQACSDDPQVAFHAIRNFTRLARGTAVLRWSQLGFGKTSSTSSTQQTPRNLMGFKDGTRNIKDDDHATLDEQVWVGEDTDQPWMAGGSYLVARRIRMLIENWDTDDLRDQEATFGRVKDTGAPLTGHDEFDTPDFDARDAEGTPIIDPNAHIRLAAPENNGGVALLRRGYSYTDGIDNRTGYLDAGLFFICFQRDPRRQFVSIQRRLGQHDLLTEYVQHTGSAVFACPPGLSGPGDWWGKQLFTA